MNGISRDTFAQMDVDSKLNILFDYTVESVKVCKSLDDKTDKLEMKAARWGAAGGIVTAIGAYLASLFIGHISVK